MAKCVYESVFQWLLVRLPSDPSFSGSVHNLHPQGGRHPPAELLLYMILNMFCVTTHKDERWKIGVRE